MAIQLLSAILAQDFIVEDEKKRFHIIDPAIPVKVPITIRENIKAQGKSFAELNINFAAIISLWNGRAGQVFKMSSTLIPPEGEAIPMPVTTNTWRDLPFARVVMVCQGHINFYKSGVFEFKVLLDGEPLTSLPFPVYWEDEFPTG